MEISWFVYVIRLSPEIDRDKVLVYLQHQGIGCARYFAPIHLQPAFRDHGSAQTGKRAREQADIVASALPITESVARQTLAIPFFNRLSDADAMIVTNALQSAIAKAGS